MIPERRTSPRFSVWLFAAAALAAPVAGLATAQMPTLAEDPAIRYSATAPTDRIARLQDQIAKGEVTLAWDEAHGYLASLLAALKIPVSSQGLVFSRTSFQIDRIAPWSPRAIYFDDEVYVGWVQGGPVIEISSIDPKLGAVFYTLSQDPQKPSFERQTQTCLLCHDSSSVTGGVPGLIVRSVFPDRYGYMITALGDGTTTDQTPIKDRWGGWYVTGSLGGQRHLGNIVAPVVAHEASGAAAKTYLAGALAETPASLTDLKGRVNTTPYLSRHSDVVALLVLAHQGYVHNLITIANFGARRALYEEAAVSLSTGRTIEGGHTGPTMMQVKRVAEPLVRGLLFSKEAELDGPVTGTSGFAEAFAREGPRDRQGRSLRDLDLRRRMFKYPLSYLIYSEGFESLPPVVTQYVYRRLREVLSGEDQDRAFAHLTAEDRQAILEILRDTKPAFAAAIARPGDNR